MATRIGIVDSDVQALRQETKLLHAIEMERKAGTRVRRAATLLRKWQATRRRIERRIGQAEVRRITNRLTMSGESK